jgi:hypothetical protein
MSDYRGLRESPRQAGLNAMRALAAFALLIGLAGPAVAQHKPGSHGPPHVGPHVRTPSSTVHTPRTPRVLHSSPTPGAPDSHGRLERSVKAKDDFMKSTGHPHGWAGHVVDHIVPLACGGADAPSNMQWQTTAEAKAKDKVERKGCSR